MLAVLDVLVRPSEAVPVVLVVSASELNQRGGALLRQVGLDAIIRVDDLRARRTVAWIVPAGEPPERVRAILDRMPPPGEANDQIVELP